MDRGGKEGGDELGMLAVYNLLYRALHVDGARSCGPDQTLGWSSMMLALASDDSHCQRETNTCNNTHRWFVGSVSVVVGERKVARHVGAWCWRCQGYGRRRVTVAAHTHMFVTMRVDDERAHMMGHSACSGDTYSVGDTVMAGTFPGTASPTNVTVHW